MYSELFNIQSNLYKALANPKRVEIMHLLRDQEMSVSDMQSMLGLPQANLSQHLQVLRDYHVVTFRREGKNIYYKLSHHNLIQVSDLFRELLIDQNRGNGIDRELKLSMKDLVPVVHDPVCGMRLSPKTASYMLKINRSKFFFCAEGCMKEYQKQHESR
ncbi:metalloregulator ArsR/SmtB family transcription factor [Candidatus Roizmanbacteria bacterium]|nr:metalloregulator ArsR/SmtB family transcription factor [Candidatus Roizmanbacteria bacterium]